jgi:hypothetical protein
MDHPQGWITAIFKARQYRRGKPVWAVEQKAIENNPGQSVLTLILVSRNL